MGNLLDPRRQQAHRADGASLTEAQRLLNRILLVNGIGTKIIRINYELSVLSLLLVLLLIDLVQHSLCQNILKKKTEEDQLWEFMYQQ